MADVEARVEALQGEVGIIRTELQEIKITMAKLDTTLRFYAIIGIALVAVLAWNARESYRMNGSVSSLAATSATLNTNVTGLQTDMRQLRVAIDER